MSTMPMSDWKRGLTERPSTHRAFWIALASFAVIWALIYSGRAWVWFRPVVHKPLINKYAAEYHFDPLWVMSIIKVESGFSAGAHSHRGALGLMQLIPSTAREIAPEIGLTHFQDDDLRDPETNIRLGVYYLGKLARMFTDDDVAVLAAWNAGPGITQQWRRGKPALELEDIEYPETRRFIHEVDRTFGWLKVVQGWKYLFGMAHGQHAN